MEISIAPSDVQELAKQLKDKDHSPRLEESRVVVCFDDSKPFKKDRFNLGVTRRIPPIARLLANGKEYDFMVQLPREAYEVVLNPDQRLALLDLRLECCQVEYVPETNIVDGKKKVTTDDWGRVVYTDEIKRSKRGEPVWKVVRLDLTSYQANVRRYGCWCDDLLSLRSEMARRAE